MASRPWSRQRRRNIEYGHYPVHIHRIGGGFSNIVGASSDAGTVSGGADNVVRALLVVFLAAAVALGHVGAAAAQTGGGYDLSWNTTDNSGGITFATGGVYELGSTVGQADAGLSSGGAYSLNGGFWQRFVLNVYVPVALR